MVDDVPDVMTGRRSAQAATILASAPNSRLADLAAREAASNLTEAERLAIAILSGKEDAVQPLIDAAQEEFGQGQYRVPVRVVTDWNKSLLVLTLPGSIESREDALGRLADQFAKLQERLIKNGKEVLVLHAGAKLEVFESAVGGAEVKRGG